ncbi:MAG: hypothetical protein ACI9YE_000536 [Psychroserpens sp.]|jgi:hypothetical protein
MISNIYDMIVHKQLQFETKLSRHHLIFILAKMPNIFDHQGFLDKKRGNIQPPLFIDDKTY